MKKLDLNDDGAPMDFQIVEARPHKDVPTHGRCGECEWDGLLENCETEEESEGWEYPSYTVVICPNCGAVLDDYY